MPFIRERQPGPFDFDPNGRLSLPALIRHLQEVADLHVASRRLRLGDLPAAGRQWIITDFTAELDRPVPAYEEFLVETMVVEGAKGVRALRDWRVRDRTGTEIGRAKSTWVMIDRGTKRPVAVPPGTFEPEPPVELRYAREPHGAPGEAATEVEVTVAWTDLDLNDHANHVRYFEWMMAALPEGVLRRGHACHFDIRYQREATLGARLRSRTETAADGTARHEILDEGGQPCARARSRWSGLP